jgi:hypothetical protein
VEVEYRKIAIARSPGDHKLAGRLLALAFEPRFRAEI